MVRDWEGSGDFWEETEKFGVGFGIKLEYNGEAVVGWEVFLRYDPERN